MMSATGTEPRKLRLESGTEASFWTDGEADPFSLLLSIGLETTYLCSTGLEFFCSVTCTTILPSLGLLLDSFITPFMKSRSIFHLLPK